MNDPRPETFYTDYLDAAERHIAACKELGKRLDSNNALFKNEQDKAKIIQEIYYLSGYIVECLLCYALGSFLDEETPNENVATSNILEISGNIQGKLIKFRGVFAEKDHAYTAKLSFLRANRTKVVGIPFVDKSYSLPENYNGSLKEKFDVLFEHWNPHCRYKFPDNLKQNILEKIKDDDVSNPYVIYQYVSFLIRFTSLIKRRYSYRTL